mmetsp:Transcript_21950/g.55321  ORF Transcript_21950/g.55321 Transcript_21950/m.55321 type:complete len:135 (-) Transcript_21950:881-1285(-)|eukprot:CAMPEP_0178992048 /NCGR_PEP_ID=MMETSP0795-20121207/5882_1 /TAXON_ID=88552 /ORGANISM="Amoebophrya sp., Strain Ameob2" /LENGTH=134 /DNA_ID=CAMNT_0020683855 /DNA_START=194 /DNA_END=598 /DNA_ORIENTATION=-
MTQPPAVGPGGGLAAGAVAAATSPASKAAPEASPACDELLNSNSSGGVISEAPSTRRDFLGPFISLKAHRRGRLEDASTDAESEPEKEMESPVDSDSDSDSDEEPEPETHWGWTVAKYCGMGLITLAILFDEME